MPSESATARKILDGRFTASTHKESFRRPPSGWIRTIRQALGMTGVQLSARLGVSTSRIAYLEKAEVRDGLTLSTLRSAAAALGCEFVYAIVPRTSLEQIVQEQARQTATAMLASVQHTMQLEDQLVDARTLASEQMHLASELIASNIKRIWDQP